MNNVRHNRAHQIGLPGSCETEHAKVCSQEVLETYHDFNSGIEDEVTWGDCEDAAAAQEPFVDDLVR